MTYNPTTLQAASLLERYRTVRAQSVTLCQPLEAEDYVVQPITDVSPPKWHLGHVTWFFENFILLKYLDTYQLFDERLNWFFNSYYESQGPRILRSNRGNMTRPNLETVIQYRNYVDDHMQQFLQKQDSEIGKDLIELIELGLQHEQQHQELLVTDIKYILGNNPLFPVYQQPSKAPQNKAVKPSASYLKVEEGIYEIGHQSNSFCFDNELNPHKVFLHEYEIQDRLTTNGEYIAFIEDGGYEQFQFWLSEGWEWVKQLEEKAPLYWFRKEDQWFHFTMNGLLPVDPNLPLTHISYFEANAYANWKGSRLPTEFEWEIACQQFSPSIPQESNFLESNQFHPVAQQTAQDFQFLGNVWEWTASAYLPYPNYPRLEGALGEYNGKFMINQMVLRGGSCATPKSHIRPTYRNFFHPDKRWQFTGVRLAK